MHILVCAATGPEIQPTITQIAENKFGGTIDVLITGVGLTCATYYLTKQVITKPPQLIIQAGVCGSLKAALENGNVVVVEHETIGDEMVMENGCPKSLFDLGLCEENKIPWTNRRLKNKGLDQYPVQHLQTVNSVSVNEISTDEDRIKYYRETLGVDIESLEGAALHFVGLSENIPFLQLRAVSNQIGERDKERWKLKVAIQHLNKELEDLLSKLSSR